MSNNHTSLIEGLGFSETVLGGPGPAAWDEIGWLVVPEALPDGAQEGGGSRRLHLRITRHQQALNVGVFPDEKMSHSPDFLALLEGDSQMPCTGSDFRGSSNAQLHGLWSTGGLGDQTECPSQPCPVDADRPRIRTGDCGPPPLAS
uniref:Uncharacterized protein n=1 Tax=Rangifer tarandus platyrhynchus TaxID=3082113 RepID=A0ACB0DZR3_RANTA|nr:unnamed protein product [Rangifer tarandus platyrhynchus]